MRNIIPTMLKKDLLVLIILSFISMIPYNAFAAYWLGDFSGEQEEFL